MTTLNAAFESKLVLEDEGYKSGSENFKIPTIPEEPLKSTMFPVSRIPLLIQLHHTAQVPANHIANL